jgi:hypothetical protein
MRCCLAGQHRRLDGVGADIVSATAGRIVIVAVFHRAYPGVSVVIERLVAGEETQ